MASGGTGDTTGLGPAQKAAILLVSLGRDLAAAVIRQLPPEQAELLSAEMVSVGDIDPETRRAVVAEFRTTMMGRGPVPQSGSDRTGLAEHAHLGDGTQTAASEEARPQDKTEPFWFIRSLDPGQVRSFIQGEHPQIQALVLAHLPASHSAAILATLPRSLQAEVARRIATLDRAAPDVVRQVEAVLEEHMASLAVDDARAPSGGVEALVEILARVDRATERTILGGLAEVSPELAEEIRNCMFVFEDIAQLDNRSIQQVLMQIETGDLCLALKTASEEVRQRVFRNMSSRAAERIREDMEYMGPVRLRQVEAAQQRIVRVVRRLEDAGEIVIGRGAEDEFVA